MNNRNEWTLLRSISECAPCSVQGVPALEECLEGTCGSRVLVVDKQEELGVYIRGHPFTCRELEMQNGLHAPCGHLLAGSAMYKRQLRDKVVTSSSYWANEGFQSVLLHEGLRTPYPQSPSDSCVCRSHGTEGESPLEVGHVLLSAQ